jgi:MFS transporter, DHA1 family, inner membrane transport protein
MQKSILALTTAAFGIGTTEFIIMGLLPDLARDFRVSIPRAGILVSGYALSVTLGSPLVALAMSRMERKKSLVLLMGIFVLGNLLCAIAPTFGLMLAARIATALCHGAFFGTGSIVAANLVPKNQRVQAITLMFSGLTLANVVGVPAGTAIGHAIGWRWTFVCIAPIGVAAMIGILALVPKMAAQPVAIAHEFRTVLKPKVQLVLALSTISSTSLFAVYTYIAPMLLTVTHVSPRAVTWILVLFGVGITIGNIIGGKLGDWKQMATVLYGCTAVLIALLIMPMAEPYIGAIGGLVLLWGGLHFLAIAPLQARIVEKARNAPNLASTLNQGAFNMGNALGASLGGLALTMGYGYRKLPLFGAAIMAVVIVLCFVAIRLDRTQMSDPDAGPPLDFVPMH